MKFYQFGPKVPCKTLLRNSLSPLAASGLATEMSSQKQRLAGKSDMTQTQL